MRNKLKSFIYILFCFFLLSKSINANEPFIFNVTEIEILKNGNQINGYKGGTAISEDGSTITAENFFYNKLTNILEAIGNVKYIDESRNSIITTDKAIYLKNQEKIFTNGNSKAENENNIITADSLEYDKINNLFKAKKNAVIEDFEKNSLIYADEITYLKSEEKIFTNGNSKAENENNIITADSLEYDKINNLFKAKKNAVIEDFEKNSLIYADEITYLKSEEKIFTNGKTKALIEDKYTFYSENVSYLREIGELSSQKKSTAIDDNENIYELANFLYDIENEILKGKKVNVLAKVGDNKIDKYFFSEAFFNFKDKSHSAKITKIKTHKEIFDNENQDPRIYGSSSFSDENKTVIKNGIFTSCKINDDCPPWSIKAETITHDKIKQDMIYENAILKIYDFPVLYFPKFYHPDPTVKRRSGFLRPLFNNSETLGSSLYVPYFKTLGNNKDLTFKTTLFEKLKNFKKAKNEKYIFQTEFRKKEKDSYLIADLGLLRNYKSSADAKTKNANHFFLNYVKDFDNRKYLDSRFETNIQRVNNKTYLKVFQNNIYNSPVLPNSKGSVFSNVKYYRDYENQYFLTGIEVYEDLGARSSDKYQYTLPYYNFSKNLDSENIENNLHGYVTFSSGGSNTLAKTNNLRTTISNNFSYTSKDLISDLGIKNNFNLYLKNLNSVAKNDGIYTSDLQIDGKSIMEYITSFPLLKSKSTHVETLTPKVSFRVNPGNNMNDHNGSSSIINASNAFDINRLGIGNDFESGKSITLGLDYKFDLLENITLDEEDIKDKYIEFKLSTVLRDEFESNIPNTSTINRKTSNLFGSINNQLFDNVNFSYDFSLDNDFKTIDSNTISTEISVNNFVTTFNYIEQRNELGNVHILSNTTEYTSQ
jgi:LPS-assembly protein